MGLRDLFRRKPSSPEADSKPKRQRRSFDGAAVNRLTSSWLASYLSIDQELRLSLDHMRHRARDLYNNNEYVKKFARSVSKNVVGPQGFRLQPQVVDLQYDKATKTNTEVRDDLANKAISRAWAAWCRKGICEMSGKYSLLDVQRTCAQTVATDGEFLIRKIRGKAAGNPFNFALQVLDIDRLDTFYNVAPQQGKNAIVMGVEIDAYQRPVAYHLFKSDPYGPIGANRTRERVPASDIIHGFLPEKPEQTRGIPWVHAAMRRLHDLGGYREAAIIAARVGAAKMGFITSPDGTTDAMADSRDPEDGVNEIEAEAGTFPVLPEGYGFQSFNPDYPHAQFEPFNKAMLRGVFAALDVSYHINANDLDGVNYSSIRSAVLDERDGWMGLQGWMIEWLMQDIYEDWLSMALLSAAIVMPNGAALPASKLDKFKAYTFIGRRWTWVDPQKDILANVVAIQNGLTSPQRVASAMGLDVDDVLNELADFQQKLKAKGIELAGTTMPAKIELKPNPAEEDATQATPSSTTGKTAEHIMLERLQSDESDG